MLKVSSERVCWKRLFFVVKIKVLNFFTQYFSGISFKSPIMQMFLY